MLNNEGARLPSLRDKELAKAEQMGETLIKKGMKKVAKVLKEKKN